MVGGFLSGMRPIVVFTGLAMLFPLAGASEGTQSPVNQEQRDRISRLTAAIDLRDRTKEEAVIVELTSLGDAALPVIEEGLSSADRRVRRALIRALCTMDTPGSTDLLLKIYLNDSDRDVESSALTGLQDRSIDRCLAREEMEALSDRVGKENVIYAGYVAGFLARSAMSPVEGRVKAVLARFMSEVESPTKPIYDIPMYVSAEIAAKSLFLAAFEEFGEDARPMLQKRLEGAKDDNMKLWLRLALGMSGEASVGEDLREIVGNRKEEVSLRALALRAYAAALKRDAMSLL